MSQLKICPQCGTEYELDQRFCPKDGSTLRMQSGSNDLVGNIIADRYHVLRKLGEGGMGQVYLAEHVKMGRKSAVKVMNPGMVNDADAISRFNREAANASRINHPNVAAVYDFGETADGLIYLAMEFIEGPSLTSLIEQHGALTPIRAADINRQAADALTVAHDMGIVHRDLKPDNIMIAKNRDGGDLVKVVDFGIAKAANSEAQKVTKTGLVVGTPEYMSPEQLAGDKLDGRSDTYSLALVAFNMLTGRLPFPAETVQESMIMRLTDRPRRLQEMRGDIAWSEDVQAVLDKALERDANLRYQTASEFGRDLYRAIEAMPITQVAEAGTMVIDASAIPSTRVASAAERGPSKGSTKVGAAPVAAAPAKKSRLPLIAAGVGLLIVGGGGAYVMSQKGPMADTGSVIPAGQTTGALPNGQRGGDSVTGVAANPGSQSNSPAPSDATDSKLAELYTLMNLERNPSTEDAARALRELNALRLTTPDHRVQAGLIRAYVAVVRQQDNLVCPTLRSIEQESLASRFATQVTTAIQTLQCQ